MSVDLAAENARLRFALTQAIIRLDSVWNRVTNDLDHTAPCAVLAVDVRAIVEGRRDPKAGG